jgi:hypothetical protein
VQSNPRLAAVLEQFSATNPPPSDSGLWTLDGLFFLPRMRLKYYQKLYNRLLKNTDNRLLIDAVDTLNMLIAILDSRQTIQVGDQNLAMSAPPALDTEDEVVIDTRIEALSPPSTVKALRTEIDVVTTASESNSNRGTSSWEGYGYFLFIHLTTHLSTGNIFLLSTGPLHKRSPCQFQTLNKDLPQTVHWIYSL